MQIYALVMECEHYRDGVFVSVGQVFPAGPHRFLNTQALVEDDKQVSVEQPDVQEQALETGRRTQ